MRINRFFLVMLLLALASCGKKRETVDPVSPAPEEKRLEEEKSTGMIGSPGDEMKDPEVPTPGTATGEMAADAEPAATRDATPANQPAPPEKNVEADPGPVAPMEAVKPTTLLKDVSGVSSGSKYDIGKGGGGGGGAVDADKDLRQPPKRPPKTEAQATGYHDKEQDEPTQE